MNVKRKGNPGLAGGKKEGKGGGKIAF